MGLKILPRLCAGFFFAQNKRHPAPRMTFPKCSDSENFFRESKPFIFSEHTGIFRRNVSRETFFDIFYDKNKDPEAAITFNSIHRDKFQNLSLFDDLGESFL